MNKNILIREATATDYASLAQLMTDLGYPTTENEMKTRLSNIVSNEWYKTFIATMDERIIGMAGSHKALFYENNGSYIRIVALVTKAEHREQGVGKALLAAVENWAKELGTDTIVLNCGNREERKAAHAFYQHLGFVARSTGYVKKLTISSP